MTGVDTRSVSRDSLFLLASIKVEGQDDVHRIRVRNLSDGGMMGEGQIKVTRGNRLLIELRNVGKVDAIVAWVQDDRFGVAFDEEIDSAAARAPEQKQVDQAATPLERSWQHRAPEPPKSEDMRKV